MALQGKLRQILTKAFPGAEIRVERTMPRSTKLYGVLVWRKWAGADQIDRQEKLWKVLDNKLTLEERARIAAILTMAPEETAVAEDF